MLTDLPYRTSKRQINQKLMISCFKPVYPYIMRSREKIVTVHFPGGDGAVHRRIPRDFISFTIDTSLIMGGRWWGKKKGLHKGLSTERVEPLDLENKRLRYLARALKPAILRIGGTEADHVEFRGGKKSVDSLGLSGALSTNETPSSGRHALTMRKDLWKSIHSFVEEAGFKLLFTVSAGPADRGVDGSWQEQGFLRLASYCRYKKLDVYAWELGNEVNGFSYIHGRKHKVSGSQYNRDFARFSGLLRQIDPYALCVGPASAVWPRIGEPRALSRSLCSGPAAGFLDALSWHYYPLQSHRGRFATRRAQLNSMLSPRVLDECARVIRKMNRSITKGNRCRPAHRTIQNWMTETAHALYGGEAGLSDTFVSSLWWMDELCLAAREGVTRLFRQSLIGSDYGLLDQRTMEVRPDYYIAFLWKKLVGECVYLPRVYPHNSKLRLYMHSWRGESGYVLIAIHLHKHRSMRVTSDRYIEQAFVLTGLNGFASRDIALNGTVVDEELVHKWGSKTVVERYKLTCAAETPPFRTIECPPLSIVIICVKK